MSQWYSLWFVLIILYLQDCIITRQKASYLIISGFRRRIKLVDHVILSFRNRVIAIGGLLPWESQYILKDPQIAISPIAFAPIPDKSGKTAFQTVKFSEVHTIRSLNRDVLVNDQVAFQCEDSIQAENTVQLLERLRTLSENERENEVIRGIANALDIELVRKQSHVLNATVGNLRAMGLALWVVLFVAFPILVSISASIPAFFMLGSIAALLLVHVALEYYFSLNILRPSISSGEICSALLQIGLCPAVAARAGVGLDPRRFIEYHPLAVACGLSGETPNRITDLLIRRTIVAESEASVGSASGWFLAKVKCEAERQLKKTCPLFLESALKAPKQDNGSRSYCPRCHTQYVTDRVDCIDCAGVALISFSQ